MEDLLRPDLRTTLRDLIFDALLDSTWKHDWTREKYCNLGCPGIFLNYMGGERYIAIELRAERIKVMPLNNRYITTCKSTIVEYYNQNPIQTTVDAVREVIKWWFV